MRGTYAWELGAAVTAFGSSATLLQVQQTEVATGGLDHADLVGAGVVAVGTIMLAIHFLLNDMGYFSRRGQGAVFGWVGWWGKRTGFVVGTAGAGWPF